MLMRALILMAVMVGVIVAVTNNFKDEETGGVDIQGQAEKTGEKVQLILQEGADKRMEAADSMSP